MGGPNDSPNFPPSEVMIKVGWGRRGVEGMPEWRLTYSHLRQVNGAKREIMVNCGDGQVKELLLPEK